MKKRISSLLLSFLLTACAFLPAFAVGESGLTVNVSDGDVIGGTVELIAFSENGVSPVLSLDGTPLSAVPVGNYTLECSASDVDYNNSVFVVGDFRGGKTLGVVSGNGDFAFPLENELFVGDTLAITFLPSVGNGAVLDTSKVYGAYNIDDMTLSGLCLTLPNGTSVYPDRVTLNKPIVGQSGVTEQTEVYTGQAISIGDGWNASTGMGGSTPEKPICFTLYFDLQQGVLSTQGAKTVKATLDTTAFSDGEHLLSVQAGSNSLERKLIIDNTAPEIVSTLKNGALLTTQSAFTFGADNSGKGDPTLLFVEDASACKTVLKIDGKTYTAGKPLAGYLHAGKTHLLSVTATDAVGNTSVLTKEFRIGSGDVWSRFTATEGSTVSDASGIFYAVTPLETESERNRFTVTVGDASEILLHYNGTSCEDLTVRLYAEQSDGTLSPIADVQSGEDAYLTVTVQPEWVQNGVLTVVAREMLYTSESDTMVWISDTQYYTRYEDLLYKYEADLDYYAELYQNGEAGFLIHTGDVADEYSPTDRIEKQMDAASKLHKRLEDLGIPYGIVDGNHDVGQSLHDATYFSKYFPADRFADTAWYYGSLNNNESHYDLITLGGYDFVLVWLGYGVEATPETLSWANEVLERFAHRNAIILTHAYLDVDADWVLDPEHPDAYTHSRAPEIWEKIVVPNENVKAVFCGHTPGVARNQRFVDDTRYVWEVLADYQFYEDGTAPKHVENGMTCDGEGFVRLVRFDGETMVQSTYSPVSGKSDPFGSAKDAFTVPLVQSPSTRTELKTEAFEAFSVSSVSEGLDAPSVGMYLVKNGAYVLQTPEVAQSDASTSEEQSGGTNAWVWILLAVVVAGACVGVIVWKKKK